MRKAGRLSIYGQRYIFPLLFFKRISDVYTEEYKVALDESDNDEKYASLKEFHRFIIIQRQPYCLMIIIFFKKYQRHLIRMQLLNIFCIIGH